MGRTGPPLSRRGVAALIMVDVLEYEDDIVLDVPEGATCFPRTGRTTSAPPPAVRTDGCGAAAWRPQ